MIKTQLHKYGITEVEDIFYNPSYETLFSHETSNNLSEYEKGTVTSLNAVAIDTGKFTGRSPKDKYIVTTSGVDEVWWKDNGSDNQKMPIDTWNHLKTLAIKQVNNKKLYVIDGFCGANKSTRLAVRLITEVSWMAHFFKNMFIRPTQEELENFKPDWTIINACKAKCEDYQKWGLNSETFVAFNFEEKMTLIGNTWYGGEIKKGIFSVMNYFLPMKNIGSFHCSANVGNNDDVSLFFGLSGTGKTTLSTDPNRKLIGDDEHGWDDDGIFNLEGGCYAKVINLSKENEPEIFKAIKRDALLENVVLNEDSSINFKDNSKTDNTRVSYPIYHIDNIVKPVSCAGHPNKIIFLTCDAYGVLPPVSLLSKEQAIYQFLSGYTAKIAGTEVGVKEPVATFSACFGKPFLLLHPTKYAEILLNKMQKHNTKAYLVNTGWIKGKYGKGERISIKETRAIINSILDSSIDAAPYVTDDLFGFKVPTSLNGVTPSVLNPKDSWENKEEYNQSYKNLAQMFIDNFKKFNDNMLAKKYEQYGPKL